MVDLPMFHEPLVAPTSVRRELAECDTNAMEESAEFRTMICRTSPMRFAVTYFFDYLVDPVSGQASVARFHAQMAREAQLWSRKGVAGERNIWVAPRESGKSVWQFLILPLWALAYGHRRFFLAFAHSEKQAKNHLATLRHELASRELLVSDFPALRPARRQGASNTSDQVVLADDGMLVARGIDAGSLGIRRGATRPDFFCGDDLEPDEANYSPEAKQKRLSTLLSAVIPMNSRAAFNVCGTTMMHESIIHDAVQHARGEQHCDWVEENQFKVRYFPAIVDRPDGSRVSMWPTKWPLAEMERVEHTALFQLEKMNLPVLDKQDAWWSDDLFVYDERAVPVPDERIMHVDVAVTKKATSDFSAIVIVGPDVSRRRVVVEYARQMKVGPTELRTKIHELCRDNQIRRCFVEVNQGHDFVRNELEPMPRGTRLEAFTSSGHKQSRIKDLLYHYEQGHVVHARRFPPLERQQRAYPAKAANDDLVDALAGGVWRLLGDPR